MSTRMALGFVCSLALMLQSSQDYPTSPVRVIEPFGAGGGPDVMARAISPKLSELWGQPVTVENHPGAGSTAAPAVLSNRIPPNFTEPIVSVLDVCSAQTSGIGACKCIYSCVYISWRQI